MAVALVVVGFLAIVVGGGTGIIIGSLLVLAGGAVGAKLGWDLWKATE